MDCLLRGSLWSGAIFGDRVGWATKMGVPRVDAKLSLALPGEWRQENTSLPRCLGFATTCTGIEYEWKWRKGRRWKPAHPGTSVVGGQGGRKRALNLPAHSPPVQSQSLLPATRWGTPPQVSPLHHLVLPATGSRPSRCASTHPARPEAPPTPQVPPSGPPFLCPVPGRVARPGPEVGEFPGVCLS